MINMKRKRRENMKRKKDRQSSFITHTQIFTKGNISWDLDFMFVHSLDNHHHCSMFVCKTFGKSSRISYHLAKMFEVWADRQASDQIYLFVIFVKLFSLL